MQAIADELGIAKPTLYVHAKSKTYLLGQIFQRMLDQGDQLVEGALAEPDAIVGVESLIRGQISLSRTYRDYYGVIYGDQRELPADLDRVYRQWSRDFVRRVELLVSRGQQQGTIRSEFTALVVAQTLIGITGWSARWVGRRSAIGVETVVRETTAMILDGLRAER
jgi:AcrR family transcriptional regulator